jgi:hypothetical protein
MLFYSDNIERTAISFYHRNLDRQKQISSSYMFKKLKKSIKNRGILDPVLCIQFKDELRIEIGEQRLLIATQLDINPLKCFIRTKLNLKPQPAVIQIKNSNDVIKYFRNKDVPAYLTIMKYIKSGVIKL